MIETLITAFVASLGTLIITCILGCYNYYASSKTKFRFLNMFPFEMQNGYKMPYSKYVRLAGAFFSISLTLFGLVLIEDKSQPISAFLLIVFLFNALAIVALFLFDLSNYKVHITGAVINFASIILMFGLYGVYIAWGINPFVKEFFSYISVAIALLLMLFLFNPRLFRFMYLSKLEENGEVKHVRPKYNIMSIYQWGAIVMTLVFQIFAIISIAFR